MIRALQKIRHYHSALGLRGVMAFLGAKLSGSRPLFKATVPGISHPVFVRIGTTDLSVLRQVLIEKHYDVALPKAPKVIVDAGANIGLSAVFFANRYPDAVIIALEPEASNFQMLQKNTSAYPRVKPLQAALWKQKGEISLIDPHSGHHGFQTVEGRSSGGHEVGMVQALTMDDLLVCGGANSIDLLKIDIEGAEKEVFENSAKWIAHVGMIMAELHDTLKPGCTTAFQQATAGFPHEFLKGETIVRTREAGAS